MKTLSKGTIKNKHSIYYMTPFEIDGPELPPCFSYSLQDEKHPSCLAWIIIQDPFISIGEGVTWKPPTTSCDGPAEGSMLNMAVDSHTKRLGIIQRPPWCQDCQLLSEKPSAHSFIPHTHKRILKQTHEHTPSFKSFQGLILTSISGPAEGCG